MPAYSQNWYYFRQLEILDPDSKEYQEVFNHIIDANHNLISSTASKYSGGRQDVYDDLVQEGVFGLIRAVHGYDYKLGYEFSTYATHWIRQAISRAAPRYSYGRIMKVPAHMEEHFSRLQRALSTLQGQGNFSPTHEEISCAIVARAIYKYSKTHPNKSAEEYFEKTCEFANIYSPDNIHRLIEYYRLSIVVSLDAPIKTSDTENSLGSNTSASENDDVESIVLQNDLRNQITALMDCLTEREKDVLTERTARTLDEVGTRLHISRERVRQIENRAIKKIRKSVKRDILIDEAHGIRNYWKEFIS